MIAHSNRGKVRLLTIRDRFSQESCRSLSICAVLVAGAVMLGQSVPMGGGATCYHMRNTGECGSNGTSQSFLECPQESCIAWYDVAGEIYECVQCEGPDGWYCSNNGQVTHTRYTAYCVFPGGTCAYSSQVLQTCISAVATSACNCPPPP